MRRARPLLAALLVVAACSRAPSTERKPIGAACTTDSACGSSPTFYCEMDHPGGYCEAGCSEDRDCPADAVCVGGSSVSKGNCHKRCVAAGAARDCRVAEGYQCIAAAHDASQDYCDPPGRSELARRLRGKAWRW